MKEYKLVLFDFDGTLVESKSGAPFAQGADDRKWMNLRLEKLKDLQSKGTYIAICTNQGGPIWRLATNNEKYPQIGEIASAFNAMEYEFKVFINKNRIIQQPLQWFISLYDQRAFDVLEKKLITDNITQKPLHMINNLKKEMQSSLPENFQISIDSFWRKPNPGMLIQASEFFNCELRDVIYVGDRQEDQAAAANAHVDFQWEHAYFQDVQKA